MLSKVIIYQHQQQIYTFAYRDELLNFVVVEDLDTLPTESILRGKITKLNHANRTAFIEYGTGQYGYINLPTWLKVQEGSNLIAQLSWHGNHEKQAKLRYGWQLVGKHLIYAGSANETKINGKNLSSQMSSKLLTLLAKFPAIWSVRSRVNMATDEDAILSEAHDLYSQAKLIESNTNSGVLASGLPAYLKLLRSLPLVSDGEVITNSQTAYELVAKLQDSWLLDVISYKSNLDYNSAIKNYQDLLTQSQVMVAGGAMLDIHTVAGINIIDVNTGTLNLSGSKVNFIVLDEIYRQICLRNLQGIILIDVIKNMHQSDEQRIVSYLQKLFSIDISKAKVLGFSHSGLLEIIRNKV